jgi:alkylhydroperoxidase family enzyme
MHRVHASLILLPLVAGGIALANPVAPGSPRIAPLPADEWSPEVRRLLGGTRDRVAALEGETGSDAADASTEPKTLNILRTIAHHPKLLGPFLGFATVIGQEGELARRDSELLALRTSWNCQSEFEWGHHVEYARAAGITEREIASIIVGPEAPGWSSADRALLRAADQLHTRQQIEDATWQALAARYTTAQLVEIPFVVGQYTMLSMVASSTGVTLEAGYDRLPSK